MLARSQSVDRALFFLPAGKYRTQSNVDVVVYDFGAISVIYSLPVQGPLSDLLGLSQELYDKTGPEQPTPINQI
jgi:hypothetical protein